MMEMANLLNQLLHRKSVHVFHMVLILTEALYAEDAALKTHVVPLVYSLPSPIHKLFFSTTLSLS